MRERTFFAAAWVLAFVSACGGGGSETPDARVTIDAGGVVDVLEPDAPQTGDGNDDFNEAVELTVGDVNGASEKIQAPFDHDYYRFTGMAGQWVVVFTEANPMDDPDMLDTVVTMFGPDSTTLKAAENDDAVPRVNTDSEIVVRLPADGVYHLEVQDYTDWVGGIGEFGPDYDYTIRVIPLTPSTPSTYVEPAADPGNDAASASPIMAPHLLASKFDTATDIDVFSFTLPGPALFEASAMPDGPDGYGSTSDIGNMWITDATGTTVIGRVNAAMGPFDGPFQVSPPLGMGTYLLFVERQQGAAAGTNDFWVGKAFTGTENPRELETLAGQNDTITLSMATMDTITMTPIGTPGMETQGFILAELSTLTDVDVLGFALPSGQNASVFCSSARNGSGVQGLVAELRRPDDSVAASVAENLIEGVAIRNVNLGPAGTYYLRLSKTGQDATVTGTWVRCGVFTFPPAP